MLGIHDLPEVLPRLVRWTVEDYERMAEEGRVPRQAELIRGLIIEKVPKSPRHRALTKWLYDWFSGHRSGRLIVFQEAPLRLADSEPEPDVSLIRGQERDFSDRHPTTAALVVEVAVSSAALDRANASLYAEAGVEEYWIILGLEAAVEVYSQPQAGTYRQVQLKRIGETLGCAALPDVTLAIGDLFARPE